MQRREEAIKDVADRVYKHFTSPDTVVYDGFQLKHFELTPIESVNASMMPCILFLEGDDVIQRRSNRTHLGYPLTRAFSLMGEVWVHADEDSRAKVLAMYKEFRNSAFPISGKLEGGAAIRETQVLGPFAETHEGSIGMRITMEIIYEDNNL